MMVKMMAGVFVAALSLAGCHPAGPEPCPVAVAVAAAPLAAPGPGEVAVQGELLRLSAWTAAQSSRYADGYFTAEFRIVAPPPGTPNPVTVILPGFRNRVRQPAADYQAGDRLELHWISFEQLSPEAQSVQIIDTLHALDQPWYWVTAARRLP